MTIFHLYWIVLQMMLSLVPVPDDQSPISRHGALALAISTVVLQEPPLFKNDPDRIRSAALIVAVAFRESSLRTDAVGDSGRSKCAMQIYNGDERLLWEPESCIRTGHHMLQESIRMDRSEPVAFYARGPRFKGKEAVRLSRDRVAIAERLVRDARPLSSDPAPAPASATKETTP